MEQSSSEANNHLAIQEIPLPSWISKINYHVHKIPPLVPIVKQMHPVCTSPPSFCNTHSNIILSFSLI